MTVVDFSQRRAQKARTQQERLQAVLEDSTWFPEYEVEPRTGIARFDPKDLDRLWRFFDFFCIKVPVWAHFEAVIAAWSYLWEKAGQYVDYRLGSGVTYRATTDGWTPEQHAFIDALIEGNEKRIRELGQQLGFFDEAQRIIGARDIVNERGPAIRLEGLPEALARQVAPEGWQPPPKPPKAPKTPRRPRKKAGPPKLRLID